MNDLSADIAYIKEKRVTQIVEYLSRELLQHKPDDPIAFLHKLTEGTLPPHIMITGAPASGKGTQCDNILDYFQRTTGRKPVHISSGDLLRAEVKSGSELGRKLDTYMSSGRLVPDELVISVIQERLRQDDVVHNGWLLDGFPRTKNQAAVLDSQRIAPDVLVVLDVPDEVLLERVEGRRTDPVTGAIYHLKFNPPPQDQAVLDRLTQRSDDKREVLIPRIEEFHKYADGVIEFYAAVAERIDGTQATKKIGADIAAVLAKYTMK